MADRCSGTTKAGDPCRAYAVEGSCYCQAHDPALAAERQAWRRAGGKVALPVFATICHNCHNAD